MKQRITWIDVARFWGMFCIYVGHFGETAGRSYPFAFLFHVPLFFFLSGCTENLNRETRALKNIRKKAQGILLPFFFFALLSILLQILLYRPGMNFVKDWLVILLKGCVRNTFLAGALWFLSCLFVISVLFEAVKLLRHRWLMLAVCLLIHYASEKWLPFRPAVDPRWYYNLDSALYYLVFYCLGYVLFPLINRVLEAEEIWQRVLVGLSFGAAVVFAVSVFYGKNVFARVYGLPVLDVVGPLFVVLLLIWFVIGAAFVCRRIRLFQAMGRNSLYLCGSEFLIKSLVPYGLLRLGFVLNVDTPVKVFLYSFVLLVAANYTFAPLEKLALTGIRKTGDLAAAWWGRE